MNVAGCEDKPTQLNNAGGADWRIAGMRLHLGQNPISAKFIMCTICGSAPGNVPTTSPSCLFRQYAAFGHVRAGAGGCEGRNIFSFNVAECRFQSNVVVGFIDEKVQRRHTGNVTKAAPTEPFPFVANFAPDKN